MRVTCALIAAALGCQAPPATVDEDCPVEAPPFPGDEYPALAQLPGDGCVPGSFAGVDVEGIWHMEGGGPFRLQRKCGRLYATGDAWAEQTDDAVTWGSADASYGYLAAACRVEPDGALWGHRSYYDPVFGQPLVSEFTARRFDWIEGEGEGDGVELVSRWAGPANDPWPTFLGINVRVHDRVAYFVAREGLRIIDVSDPAAPFDLGFYPSRTDQFNDVKIIEDASGVPHAVLSANNLGVTILDVSDPSAPREVRRFDPIADGTSAVHTLFTQPVGDATWAYFVSGGTSVLGVYDVTTPSAPAAITQFDLALDAAQIRAPIHDLYVEGDRVYLNATSAGLVVVDMSNPSLPRVIGQRDTEDYSHSNWVTTAGGRTISVHGGEGYGEYVKIIDVDESSPTFMEIIGEFRLRENVSVHNIMAVGERAYIAYYQNGLRVLDLSDPTRPRQIAYYNTWDPERARGGFFEGAIGVDVDDRGLIYVADTESGLFVLRETR